jgi:type IV secretory pathway VirB2 component (pilin)
MTDKLHTLSLRASYVALSFLAAPKAFAGDRGNLFGPVPDIGGVSATDTLAIRESVLSVLDVVLGFMALIAVIVVVIAGIRLVISQGEEQEKDKAKKTIFYAIIGLIIILFAQAIVGFIQDIGDTVGTGS